MTIVHPACIMKRDPRQTRENVKQVRKWSFQVAFSIFELTAIAGATFQAHINRG